jgi:type I restriction enzyme S subunit
MSWAIKTFGDIFVFLPKSKLQASFGLDKGLYKFFTSSPIQKKWIDDATFNTQALVFGTGGSASIHFIEGMFSTSTDCLVAQPKDADNIYLKYVYHFLSSNINLLQDGFKGAGLKHISKTYIENLKIPLPSLVEQKRIAAILNKAAEIKAKREQAIAKLDDLSQSMFMEMFGDDLKGELFELKEISVRVTDGTHQAPKWTNSGVPFIFISNIVEDQINFETKKYISNETYDELTRNCKIEVGDVLYTTVGSYGNVAVIKDEKKFCFQRHIAQIKPNKERVAPVFLASMLKSVFVRQQIDKVAKGIAQKTVNLGDLGKVKVICPSIHRQNKFADKVRKIDELKLGLQEANNNCKNLLASLQHQAFTTGFDA